MSDPFHQGSHPGNSTDDEDVAQGVPMVDIIDIRAKLGAETLRDSIGK